MARVLPKSTSKGLPKSMSMFGSSPTQKANSPSRLALPQGASRVAKAPSEVSSRAAAGLSQGTRIATGLSKGRAASGLPVFSDDDEDDEGEDSVVLGHSSSRSHQQVSRGATGLSSKGTATGLSRSRTATGMTKATSFAEGDESDEGEDFVTLGQMSSQVSRTPSGGMRKTLSGSQALRSLSGQDADEDESFEDRTANPYLDGSGSNSYLDDLPRASLAKMDATTEMEHNLEKDLLKTQLGDLDSWISKVRSQEDRQGKSKPMLPPLDTEDFAPPGVESLLRAQVQELEGWLIEARTPLRQEPAYISRMPENDEELLLAVRRERNWAVRREWTPKEDTKHAQQRLESAFETLKHMKEAETQRELALQQTRSVGLRTSEDFQRLFGQLHELEGDPLRAPDLARYSITDVALALVNAIEQRRALSVSLEAALVSQDRVRLGAEGHEQLLACAAALPTIQRHAAEDGVDSPEVCYAPASQLTLPQGPFGEESFDVQDVQTARLHKLAEKNRYLWEQLYGHWDAGTRAAAQKAGIWDPSLSSVPYADGSYLSATGTALQSELKTLRNNEGRLDSLLGHDTGGLVGKGTMSHLPGMESFLDREEELKREHRPARVAGHNPLDLGHFTTLTMEMIIRAWHEIAHTLNEWRRSRRKEACEKFLSRPSSAKALRYWLGCIKIEVARAMPKVMTRGGRVKDLANNSIGTFLSSTPKGICKVQWGTEDASLRPISMLAWMRTWSHPAYGGLFFLAWARILVVREKQQIGRFRAKVLGTKHEGKTSNMLVWLSLQAHESTSLMRIIFESWAKISVDIQKHNKDLLADIMMAWRHGAMKSRHHRACNELESTSGELRETRMTLLRQTKRFDRLQQNLFKIDEMQNGLFLSYVISSWQYAIRLERMSGVHSAAGREDRVKMALNLTSKMGHQVMSKMLPAIFLAWAWTTKKRFEATKHQALLSQTFTQASLSVSFHEWKHLVTGVHQNHSAAKVENMTHQLVEREEDFKRLQGITEDLYNFSKEADGRIKDLESALTAADKAVEAGTSHGSILEKEVSSLETQLRALEARVRRGEEAERELKAERDNAAGLKVDLSTTRADKETIVNKIGVLEQQLQKTSVELDAEQRLVKSFEAEKIMLQGELEGARADAIEWKVKAGDGILDQIDSSDSETDILDALEKDAEGGLTKRGKKDLKKLIRKGKISQEAADAHLVATDAGKDGLVGKAHEERKERAWVPEGDYLPPFNAMMALDTAYNIVDFGVEIVKKTPGTVFNKTEQLYFVVFSDSEDKYLCYYKNAEERNTGVARGAFTLKDVASAMWDGQLREIRMTQGAKKDSAVRTLTNVPNSFFEALLVVTREAEYRRIHHIFHGRPKEEEGDEAAEGGKEEVRADPASPTRSMAAKDPAREAQRQARKEAGAKALQQRLQDRPVGEKSGDGDLPPS